MSKIRERLSGVGRNLSARETRPVTIALLAGAGLLLLGLVYWEILLLQLPSTGEIRRAGAQQPSVVYAADGEALANFGDQHQTWIPLTEISPHVVDALIATEDRRFYDHWGIDVHRTAGSLVRTLGGEPQGGSTITMQLARNAFPDLYEDTAITRKIKEWVTALRFEAVYEKDEILEMYLNAVPFMYNAVGIEAAARTYFRKRASALRPDEAALLVGMLKGTAYYNPVRRPDRAHERRNLVLQEMVDHGSLREATYRELEAVPTLLNFARPSRSEDAAPHFVNHVRTWLSDWVEEHGYDLDTGGLRIHTTIDRRLQQAAREAVFEVTNALQAVADVEWSEAGSPFFAAEAGAYEGRQVEPFSYFWASHPDLIDRSIRESERYEQLTGEGVDESQALRALKSDRGFVDSLKAVQQRIEAGFVALSPETGHVLAWVGGRDYAENQYDHVAVARRQPGSTFKPIVYAAALENGFSPDDRLRDEVIEYTDPETNRTWSPRNVGSATGEMITLRDALAHSKNTITAQLVAEIGPGTAVDYAHRMGIESELDPYLSIGLGTSEVSLLELTAAYGTIANGGLHREPLFITRIEDQTGRVLARFSSSEREAVSPATADQLLEMLRGVIDYGTGTRIRTQFGAGGDLAGKTGTSQEGADGWFVLAQPDLVAGAWVGFDLSAITFRSDYWGQGAHTALPIVGTFLQRAGGDARPARADSLARLATTTAQ